MIYNIFNEILCDLDCKNCDISKICSDNINENEKVENIDS